ncbi:MAG TPA: hypothetical protein VEH04_14010 [Verrucomicrobiae bacterium]|nr:hypothetical protein [Verrucomicrobiae bacterium]
MEAVAHPTLHSQSLATPAASMFPRRPLIFGLPTYRPPWLWRVMQMDDFAGFQY